MATVLVTGATGFIGAQVARQLVTGGDDVRVALRASSRRDSPDGLSTNLQLPDEELFRLDAGASGERYAAHPERGAHGGALVDVPVDPRAARAGLDDPPARGDGRGPVAW